jgi:IS5 family transposase
VQAAPQTREGGAYAQECYSEASAALEEEGLLMRGAAIADATVIEAPSSTKNSGGVRDPEMHSTKKGGQWHFAVKAHIGVDASCGLVRTLQRDCGQRP